ncbi:hypothetical protein DLM45_02850 [Hyphomicrobium methylovorum]|uniref:hypothetical protein n=1 Tax=Hyphomicrobium methylovorum TaxID=84 RepID=UPI0015E7E008|nr:hypothetical protein [Hyphomicrobium methylovorum]MBA2125163.1 hypothetical protein [Hyphomicrobium methylovorum]
MQTYIFWTFILAVVAALIAGIAVFVRAYLGGTTPSALIFRPKTERRLAVVEFANVDSRRKLILIRRDDVEHLIMTGGPVDVLVESGIASRQAAPRAEIAPVAEAAPVRRASLFGRSREAPERAEPQPPEF